LKGALIALTVLVALAAGGVAIAGAAGGDDDGGRDDGKEEAAQRIEDRATIERAEDAARRATGGGDVLELERTEDGGKGYEAEVRRGDGSTVEVNLDAGFRVESVTKDD
jgi:uncharacterized membrane protein YkoI